MIKPLYVLLGLSMSISSFAGDLSSSKSEGVPQPAARSEQAAIPAPSLGAPAGFAGSWGSLALSVAGITHSAFSNKTDGAMAVGMGFGNANKFIGGSVTLATGSVHHQHGAFGRGWFGVAVGHNFLATGTGVSVGVDNVVGWYPGPNDEGKHYTAFYAAVSQVAQLGFVPVILSVGAGNRYFSNAEVVPKQAAGYWGVFGSAAAYVTRQVAIVTTYMSRATDIGVSVVPIKSFPLVINIGAYDIFNNVGNHDLSLLGSATVAYDFDT